MLTAIRHNISRLTDFTGRDTRSQFWPWAGCVIGGFILVWFVAMTTTMSTLFGKMQAFADAHPDQATVVSGPGSYSVSIEGSHPEFVPDLGGLMLIFGGLVVVIVLLLAASVARRLHDRGRSALWGLAPLPFLVFGLIGFQVVMREVTTGVEPNMVLFFGIFLNNICYLAVLLTLIIQLSGAGQPEANRFGPPAA